MIARKREGCLTVEMEAAAFFAVAQFRGVNSGSFYMAATILARAGTIANGRAIRFASGCSPSPPRRASACKPEYPLSKNRARVEYGAHHLTLTLSQGEERDFRNRVKRDSKIKEMERYAVETHAPLERKVLVWQSRSFVRGQSSVRPAMHDRNRQSAKPLHGADIVLYIAVRQEVE